MKILVVDDHPQIRTGTAVTLRQLIAGALIVEADSMAGARAALRHPEPIDLVLLDLCLGDSDGVDTLRAFRAACEEVGRFPRIVAVSGNEHPTIIESVLKEHGTGFIPKGVPGEIFQQAIGLTLAGGVYIPEIYLRGRVSGAAPAPDVPVASIAARLTDTERMVVSFCVQGLTYKHIAREMSELRGRDISDLTVKTHVKNIAIKLGIGHEGKAAVVAQISRLGLRFPVGDGKEPC